MSERAWAGHVRAWNMQTQNRTTTKLKALVVKEGSMQCSAVQYRIGWDWMRQDRTGLNN